MIAPPPKMEHLPGFWDPKSWSDAFWAEYRRRHRTFWQRLQDAFDQAGHQLYGRLYRIHQLTGGRVGLSREWWEQREAAQWPSGTGSIDPCVDHCYFLKGAQKKEELSAIRAEAIRRRPELQQVLPRG